MATRIEATVDDLARVPEGRKAELVDGALILMPPTGDIPGESSLSIVISLRDYGRRTGLGRAVPDNVGFVVDLPNRKSFSPDAAFHDGPRSMGFIEGAPIFAAHAEPALPGWSMRVDDLLPPA